MMNCLFGKPMQEETYTLQTLDRLNRSLEMLDKMKKIKLNKAGAVVEEAKEYIRANNKRVAIQCLIKKRLYEQCVVQIGNYLLRLCIQIITLESATEFLDVARSVVPDMNAMQKATKIDDMDMTENMKLIKEALTARIGASVDIDEDELLAELEELEDVELKKKLAVSQAEMAL